MFRWNFQKASENDLAKPRAIDTVGDNHGSVSLPVTWWCFVSTRRPSPSGKGDLGSIIALDAFLFVEDVSKYLGGSSPALRRGSTLRLLFTSHTEKCSCDDPLSLGDKCSLPHPQFHLCSQRVFQVPGNISIRWSFTQVVWTIPFL